MNAIVSVENVSITRVNWQGHPDQKQYSGIVTYRAILSGLDFEYRFSFPGYIDIAQATTNGAATLKRNLDSLSVATQNLQFPS